MRRMVSILEAGARLRVSFPYLSENPQEFTAATGVPKESLHWSLAFGEQRVAGGPLPAECLIQADISNGHNGAYTLRLLDSRQEPPAEVWKQLVFCQPTQTRDAGSIHELAMKFAPVLLFSHREQYFPVSLGELLCSEEVKRSTQAIKVETIFGKEEIPLPQLAEFLRFNGHADYLLDQSMLGTHRSDFRQLHGNSERAVVYYSYLESSEPGTFYIKYHTFYAFDPKTGIAKLLGVGPHIFDRESMTLTFRNQTNPETVTVSGHLENQTISFLDKLIAWSNGRVRYDSAHPSAPQVLGHPVVPVAEGSHALYPAAGRYQISVLSELAGHIMRRFLPQHAEEDEPDELANRQVLLPPALHSEQLANYELRPLRLDLLSSEPRNTDELYDPDTGVLTFSGYWVDVPGPQNERFPPFSRKEVEVDDWIANAFPWNWDALPKDVIAHNEAITQAIRDRLSG